MARTTRSGWLGPRQVSSSPPHRVGIKIRERAADGVTILDLEGRLTLETFGVLKDTVRGLVDTGCRRLVLHLAGVSYFDSIGVAELVRSHVILGNSGGRLTLLGIPKPVGDLLTITRLHTVFESFDVEQDAVRSFSS